MSAEIENILFFSIEDLNDWIEPLGGHADALTPNLSRLAQKARVFTQAYAPAPACSPSRTATLFGQDPWETGVYINPTKWHDAYPRGQRKSLVGRLRDAGWRTTGAGKVFHNQPKMMDYEDWDHFTLPKIPSYAPKSALGQTGKFGPDYDFGPCGDDAPQSDDISTQAVLEAIQPGARGNFWALGIYRPHMPFVVPQRYFDRLPKVLAPPPGLGASHFDLSAKEPLSGLSETAFRAYRIGDQFARMIDRFDEHQDIMRAYLASVLYADEKLGLVLDRLEETGLDHSTLIVLWSDHGFQLGEKHMFHKFTLWERALRVPVMFAGPGVVAGQSDEPISLIDLAPTIFAQVGLERPEQFSGQDLSSLLRGAQTPLRGYANAVWGKGLETDAPKIIRTTRTRTHRYILYWDGTEEIYDHRTDPFEHVNLAKTPGALDKQAVDQLRAAFFENLNFDLAPVALAQLREA